MVVGRFAPSPSGRMHLGNVFTALLAWCSVRSRGGRFLLRVEDLDPDRSRPEYIQKIKQDLRELGLDWDAESPMQSTRSEAYAAAFDRLKQMGLVYPCYCTRAELHAASAPHGADGSPVYPGTCRHLTAAQRASKARPPAWRVCVPEQEISFTDGRCGPVTEHLAQQCGDFIIRRSDGVCAYQLAVVVDDAESGVTEVVRGADLLHSTPRQCYLYGCLGLPVPQFYHVPLLVAPDGRRLSKRDQDLDLAVLRQHFTPEMLLGRLACAAGFWPSGRPAPTSVLAEAFSWEKVTRQERIVIAPFFSDTL